jgi:alanine-synthesizing transaminase
VEFSQRTLFERRPNAVASALRETPARIDLTASNPTQVGFALPAAALSALAHPAGADYAPAPFGLPDTRRAVATAIGADPTRVILTASTSEAYGWLFKLLCDPGDELLVPQPSYPLLAHLAQLEGVRLRPYRLAYDGDWHVDRPSVRPGPRTRGVLVVSPNNPTGHYVSPEDLALFQSLGLPVVSDEVFARYDLRSGPPRAIPTVAHATAGLTFALGGLSKWAGLPQVKLGWIALGGAPPQVAEALARLEVVADASLSVSAAAQLAAPALLARDNGAAIHARIRRNLAAVQASVRGAAVDLLTVEGGWYATLRLPATHSEESWVLRFLRDDGVLVQPGWFYDYEASPLVVLSLLTPPATLDAGLRAIIDRVERIT